MRGRRLLLLLASGWIGLFLISPAAAAYSFVVFADLNGGGCARNQRALAMVDWMAAEPDVAFYVSTGDLIDGYGGSSCFAADPEVVIGGGCGSTEPDPFRRAALNGNVKALLKPIKEDKAVPTGLSASFFPVVGNHDDNWGSGWYPDPCGTGFCDFLGPHPVPGKQPWERYLTATADTPGDVCSLDAATSTHSRYFYYSFRYRNSTFIVLRLNDDYWNMLSCNGNPAGGCADYCTDPSLFDDPQRNSDCYAIHQYDWLREELAAATQAGSEHIFVFAHAPLLGDGEGHNPTSGAYAIRALLESYGVDIYFNGHNHAYQRTYRVLSNGTSEPLPDPSGTAYITVGVAGAAVDAATPRAFTAASHRDWVAYGDSSAGTSYEEKMATYLKITVDGDSVSGVVKSLGVSETAYPGRVVDSFRFGTPPDLDSDGDGIPDRVDRQPQIFATPDCLEDAEGYVEIANKSFVSDETCTAATALTTGVAVRVETDSQVVFQAPKVRLFPGFAIADGGAFRVLTQAVPVIAGCPILPADNMWNTPATGLPLHPDSAAFIGSIGGNTPLHPDFGTQWAGRDIGIPFDVIPVDQALVPVAFDYWDESDRQDQSCNPSLLDEIGCYPIPANPSIEGQPVNDGDRHVLLLQRNSCMLYELFAADRSSGSWTAGSGAIWDLARNQQRPAGWTSADAAGLPILPGLLRYDEVYGPNEIEHVMRMTVQRLRRAYIPPASHSDGQGGNDPDVPPMGLRLRLKADFDISGFDPVIQKILRALKKYGVVVADTGSDMFLSGQHHDDWDDDLLGALHNVTANDFEAVYTGEAVPY